MTETNGENSKEKTNQIKVHNIMNNRQRKVAEINNIEVLLQNTNCLLAVKKKIKNWKAIMKLAKKCREESV